MPGLGVAAPFGGRKQTEPVLRVGMGTLPVRRWALLCHDLHHAALHAAGRQDVQPYGHEEIA